MNGYLSVGICFAHNKNRFRSFPGEEKMSLSNAENADFHEGVVPLDGEVAELSVLVPSWQAAAIEKVAGIRGISAGQLVRSILQQVINSSKFAACV